jgi:hypothetical protein
MFIEGGFTATDVKQGEVGDCYLLAAATCLCETPELLDSVFVTAEPNAEGVYCLRWWVDNAWKWIITDARFPVLKGAYRTVAAPEDLIEGKVDASEGRYAMPTGAHSGDINEFWLAFIEKCWAKLHGSFTEIFSGTTADALLAFLPHAASHTSFDFGVKGGHGSDENELSEFDKVTKWIERGWPVCLGSAAAGEGEVGGTKGSGEAVGEDGIVKGHAFTVQRTCRAPLASEPSGCIELIQLRNPCVQRPAACSEERCERRSA